MKTQNLILVIFAFTVLLNSGLKAQAEKTNEFITIEMNISLNGTHKKDADYHITIKNLTSNEEKCVNGSNKTSLHLNYNCKYEVIVSHPSYNTKVVEFDTEAPTEKWRIITDVDLESKNMTTVYAGKIIFDKESKTFKQIKKS